MKFLFTGISALIGITMLSSCGVTSEDFWGPSYITDRFGVPDELFYQTKGSCAAGDLSFQYLMGGGAILWDVPNTQSEDDILTGQVFIYLNRDNTYTVDYREYDLNNLFIKKTFSSTFKYDTEFNILYLKNLGQATIHQRKKRYYIHLTFTENLNTNFLKGQSIDVWLKKSFTGLDTDRVQYCGL